MSTTTSTSSPPSPSASGGKEVYVTFYGGEPTLNRPLMLAVMERFPHWRFQLQTNGTLLDDMPEWALGRCPTCWSASTAARTTDGYRGKGIYRQVLKQRRHTCATRSAAASRRA
jgi:uncharacterized protein